MKTEFRPINKPPPTKIPTSGVKVGTIVKHGFPAAEKEAQEEIDTLINKPKGEKRMKQYLVDFGTIYIQAGILICIMGGAYYFTDVGNVLAKCGATIFCLGTIIFFIGKRCWR